MRSSGISASVGWPSLKRNGVKRLMKMNESRSVPRCRPTSIGGTACTEPKQGLDVGQDDSGKRVADGADSSQTGARRLAQEYLVEVRSCQQCFALGI
jgi:hypothetical protein